MRGKTGGVRWEGPGKKGQGPISTGAGALVRYPYGFASRFEDDRRGTNPEEILAAAHAACFAMAFSFACDKAGFATQSVDTQAHVRLSAKGAGFEIDRIMLRLNAAVPGIDVLLVGCTDMAAELGVPGQLGHASLKATLDTVFAACERHGKVGGVGGVYDDALMAEYIRKGARLILSGSDLAFLMAGARSRSSLLRSISLHDQTAPVA